MNPLRIVLADDHAVVRQGLRSLLEAEPDIQVVGEASQGSEVLSLCQRLDPDVLVADVMMPGLTGMEVARQMRRYAPRTQVLILSMYSNEAYVLEALRNGAAGYVLKSADADTLTEAIRTVASGRRYLCAPLTERAIEVYLEKSEAVALDPYETLTNREREVLHLMAEGATNIQIGERLSISARTVEVHRSRIVQKLELRSHTDLVRFALRRGILPPE